MKAKSSEKTKTHNHIGLRRNDNVNFLKHIIGNKPLLPPPPPPSPNGGDDGGGFATSTNALPADVRAQILIFRVLFIFSYLLGHLFYKTH